MFPDEVETLAATVIEAARACGARIVTAESCTGGLVAGALTAIPGSSDVLDRGFVTYSNAAKQVELGVPERLLNRHGAVSAEVARAMAEGALVSSGVELAVSVTGVAGPGGGSAEKPVGLVWFAVARKGGEPSVREMRFGDLGRADIRLAAVRTALEMLLKSACS